MKVTIKRFGVGVDGYMVPEGQNYVRDLALQEVTHHIYFVEKDQEYEVTSEVPTYNYHDRGQDER